MGYSNINRLAIPMILPFRIPPKKPQRTSVDILNDLRRTYELEIGVQMRIEALKQELINYYADMLK